MAKEEEMDEESRKQKRLEEATKKKKYILSALSDIRFAWDIIIIVFAVINGATLPLEIAFSEVMEGLVWYLVLSDVTIAIFTLDIIVGFFTSYINISSGDEIYGLRMIALNYIFNGSFLIDILSTFPLDIISGKLIGDDNHWIVQFFKIFGILKI